jgi:hypothetical protein
MMRLPGPRAHRYLAFSYSLLCLSTLASPGCDQQRNGQQSSRGGTIRFSKNGTMRESGTPRATTPAVAPPAAATSDERYTRDIRPIFLQHGCVGGSCHSAFRGGGFFFTGNDERELPNVRSRIDPKDPEKSELLLKATGVSQHNGGQNIAPGSCDYRRLVAWISDKPDIQCSDEPPRDLQRFTREIVPALHSLGCDTCHSQSGTAQQRLDMVGVQQASAAPAGGQMPAQLSALFSALDAILVPSLEPWGSTLLSALLASDGKHTKQFDRGSCAFRRVYGYMVGAPELSCDVTETTAPAAMPDLQTYVKQVYPIMAKRACFDSNCHGSGVKDMTLRGVESNAMFGLHDYLMLTARIEDFSQPDKSTLLMTARNKLPHGGGQRLGGAGDCVDDAISSWLRRKPIMPCKPPPPPTYERFVKEVQPVLDKMTCTQARCHGESIKGYVIKPFAKDEKTLRENYTWTLKQINVDFMPFSEVMLRMREPCAYSKVGAWIEGKPTVTCEIKTPPPSAFPKLSDTQHDKAKPGAPPASTKG